MNSVVGCHLHSQSRPVCLADLLTGRPAHAPQDPVLGLSQVEAEPRPRLLAEPRPGHALGREVSVRELDVQTSQFIERERQQRLGSSAPILVGLEQEPHAGCGPASQRTPQDPDPEASNDCTHEVADGPPAGTHAGDDRFCALRHAEELKPFDGLEYLHLPMRRQDGAP